MLSSWKINHQDQLQIKTMSKNQIRIKLRDQSVKIHMDKKEYEVANTNAYYYYYFFVNSLLEFSDSLRILIFSGFRFKSAYVT
jgi:hypothetical protein